MRILQVGTNEAIQEAGEIAPASTACCSSRSAVLTVAGMGGGAAFATDAQHGIAVTKGCVSPTQIGQPYTCTYAVRNSDRRGARHAHHRRASSTWFTPRAAT